MLKNKHILIFNGMGGVGKSTVQEMIRDVEEGILVISTVDRVKEAAVALGWDGTKDTASRKFLSDLKMLAMAYNNHSYRYVVSQVEILHKYLYFHILSVDSREIDEIERFKRELGAKTVLVRNPNVEPITSNFADMEASREDYEYDFVIDNNGSLEDLRVKVGEFLERLEK